MPLLSQLLLVAAVVTLFGGKIFGRAEVHPAAGQVGRDARLHDFLGDGAGVHIHIRNTGGAAGDHLSQAQSCSGGHGPVVQFGLGGENEVIEPVLQIVTPAVTPHQGHRHMGVAVYKAGHEHLALALHHPVKGSLRAHRPHGDDFCSLHRHKGVLQHRLGGVHGHSGDVGK